MLIYTILLLACLRDEPVVEPEHARNEVYASVLSQGLDVGGQIVRLPASRMADGQDAAAERTALAEIAGSDEAVQEMVRPSVTAPHVIKVHDIKTGDATVRAVDLWFVVHAELKQVDPAAEAARTDHKAVEVGNMLVQTHLLTAEEQSAAKIKPPVLSGGLARWYAHIHGKLLDRIEFDVTNDLMSSQSAASLVVAARPESRFGTDSPFNNRWKHLPTAANPDVDESAKPYAGGICYAKISRMTMKPEALLVEIHAAFVEPDGWFQGAPILRSKLSVAAQEQIRALRRDLLRGAKR